jgi:hypothetical protein
LRRLVGTIAFNPAKMDERIDADEITFFARGTGQASVIVGSRPSACGRVHQVFKENVM